MSEITKNEQKYLCHICDKQFKIKSYADRHIQYAHENRSAFKCNLCHKGFGAKTTCDYHIILIHTRVRPYKCKYCHYRSLWKSTLLKHLLKCENKTTNSKTIKNPNLKTQNNLDEIIEDEVECPLCKLIFSNIPTLIEHMQTHGTSSLNKGNSENTQNETNCLQNPRGKNNCKRKLNNKKLDGETFHKKPILAVEISTENSKVQQEKSEEISTKNLNNNTNDYDIDMFSKNEPNYCLSQPIDEIHTNNDTFVETLVMQENQPQIRIALARALANLDEKLALEKDLTKYICNFCSITCLSEVAFNNHMQRHD